MAVYYYPLWEKLSRYGMTQKELCEKAHISTGTIFQMKKEKYVSMDVLERIAIALNCDIGDIITNRESKSVLANGLVGLHDEMLTAVKDYMARKNYSVDDVARITTLSINTVKKFLKGEKLAEISYQKLRLLGSEWYNSLGMELHRILAKWESQNKSRRMIMSYHPNGDVFKG